MRFDRYDATAPKHGPEAVLEALAGGYPGAHVAMQEVRPLHGYRTARALVVDGMKGPVVMWGGRNADHGVHVMASGPASQGAAEALRATIGHRVSRVDVCEDFAAPGAYARLRRVCRRLALERGVKAREIRPASTGPGEGCTFYVGSSTSAVQARLYEKGKQVQGDPDHVRYEVQVRPDSANKLAAALSSPSQVMAWCAWSAALAERVLGSAMPRPSLEAWAATDDDEKWGWMLVQYGPLLVRQQALLGSWAALGAQIGQDLATRGSGGGKRPR